ncbi:MBL fold metallo-hydrolase [Granulicella arctica]|uniref:Glyoxylase-like metal-dependent hydrolase (Beta-lactamase superfamily II) n=1 Tax=Granulicella arctica TaxID=940613 RepID=A0A7Y9TGA6_9BACT|nr:MBL fold metallo-hydrolase [Granulicella arctica]NYF78535.1 glyoxylase-like metal-dependent hydrolase (beta-lactamase superfamily II) [Granulicella arctica]
MRLTRITPTLMQLTRFGLVNCYCVMESDGITLVDTGLPGSGDDILEASRTMGAQINRILLTHAHADHIGSLDDLAMKLGKVEVAISARDARLLQKDLSLDPGEPQTKIKGSISGAKTRPTHLLKDGDLYGSLRVIATPGHTPGHLCFLDERDNSLLAGDALTTVSELRVAGDAPWTFPLPNFGTWHKPTADASAKRLLEFPIQRFATGHGPVRNGGTPTLQTAITHTTR